MVGEKQETEVVEHTPTPWRLLNHGVQSMGGGVVYTAGGAHRLVQIEGPNEETVGRLEILVFDNHDGPGMAKLAANARLIVCAVNNHEALVEALRFALRESGCDGDLCNYRWHEKARAALASIDSQ